MAEEKSSYKRPSWDQYFMELAHVAAKRSKDPNTQNGSVIVNNKRIVVGMGYNGYPRGVDDITWQREGHFLQTKYAYVVHAEENAIYNSIAPTEGCICYCTLFPCNECAKTIIQSGITEVVYDSDKYHDNDVWEASRKLLDLAGVKYRQLSRGEVPIKQESEFTVRIKKLYGDSIVPDYAYQNDAGMDLYTTETVEIPAGSRAKIGTGIAAEVPVGYAALIWDKSGVSIKKGLKTLGGVVDSGYRGEIFVGIANVSKESVNIEKGEKIAQLIVQKVEQPKIEIVDDLSSSERADKSLGSSGDKADAKRMQDEKANTISEEELAGINQVPGDIQDKEGQNEESRW